MLTLGIESTCDETGAAVVLDGKTILSNVVASSVEVHAKFGGVFPELASRGHMEVIRPVVEEALASAGVTGRELDLIAVARGPGLIGSLLVGLQFAKGLAIAWEKPFIGVNHIEAHLYAAMMGLDVPMPALGMVLSGGHTLMVEIQGLGEYRAIGTTRDDAIGEAFDKVGSMLGLPYPGGPEVERLARGGDRRKFALSAGKVKLHPLDFSFSGLKTGVLYAMKEKSFFEEHKADLAAAFQETAFRDLIAKATLAIQQFPCQAIVLGGGVCNNMRLKELFLEKFPHLPLFFPSPAMTLDNAAMIAGLGSQKFLSRPYSDPLDLEPKVRIPVV
jgi:N6-L-threonylcarbamoyladenine synthase